MAAIALGSSGAPRTVTWSRPRTRWPGSPEPMVISASMPMSAASVVICWWIDERSGAFDADSNTPRTRRPRMTTCSTSSTDSSCSASTLNSRDVTPGRSRPVSVTSKVMGGPDIALLTLSSDETLQAAGCATAPSRSATPALRQQKMHVTEFVPKVSAVSSRLIAPVQQRIVGKGREHPEVRGERLVQASEQAVNDRHAGGPRYHVRRPPGRGCDLAVRHRPGCQRCALERANNCGARRDDTAARTPGEVHEAGRRGWYVVGLG